VVKKLLAHRDREIPSLVAQRPDVCQQFFLAFQRMVAKNPADRFQSMAEVIAALEACRAAQKATFGASANSAAGHSGSWNPLRALAALRSSAGARSSTLRTPGGEPTIRLQETAEIAKPGLIARLSAAAKSNPAVTAAC